MDRIKILYKRATTGKLHSWEIQKDETGTKFRIVNGTVDGKKVTSSWTECTPKNIGKSNETTSEEQCLLEIEAKITKQLDKGYVEDINKVDEIKIFKPMLANKYESWEKLKGARIMSQPKLDGIRCYITKDGAFSRSGKPFVSIQHILNQLDDFFKEYPDAILDGELYNHDLKDDFNKIVSLVKKQKLKSEHIEEITKTVQYHVYDLVLNEEKVTFETRDTSLTFLFGSDLPLLNFKSKFNTPNIKVVKTDMVEDERHLDHLYQEYMKEGYEGQMVRFRDSVYENKRSKFLLKRKEFQTEEFEIVEVQEGIGNRSGMAGNLLLKKSDGTTFGAGIKGGESFYKELLENAETYKGQLATLMFQNYTPDGIPRFPVVHSIRNYE